VVTTTSKRTLAATVGIRGAFPAEQEPVGAWRQRHRGDEWQQSVGDPSDAVPLSHRDAVAVAMRGIS
jgi:hypothetical protein